MLFASSNGAAIGQAAASTHLDLLPIISCNEAPAWKLATDKWSPTIVVEFGVAGARWWTRAFLALGFVAEIALSGNFGVNLLLFVINAAWIG